MAPESAVLKFFLNFLYKVKLTFSFRVSDFTRLSIKVI